MMILTDDKCVQFFNFFSFLSSQKSWMHVLQATLFFLLFLADFFIIILFPSNLKEEKEKKESEQY